jgi:hypothetical protein|tara:strand:+ start:8766 stop:9458 length:693 start_codon:yes stop_codon:yes gene_type:complete
MDSVIFQANVIGMLMYIIPAMLLFFYIIKGVEDRLAERKLYLACGIGVVMGSIAQVIMFLGGTDLYTELAYTSMILVTPFIIMMFMFIGVNLKTFKDEPAAPYYSAGYGLFFGGSVEFWKLLITENRYSEISVGDIMIITLFGLGTVIFLGGAGMWIAYAIRNDNGVRVAGRLAVLFLFLQYLYASALEYVLYGLHDFTLIIASIIALFVASGALFHQGYLKLPKIPKNL